MRALVLHGDYDLRVEERPDPRPGPGEVRIDVVATGICGSDFHGYSGENGRRPPGQVMGHETVGTVGAFADDVDGLRVGQLVTVNPVLACGACPACAAGVEQHCPDKSVIGVAPQISAAFAEQLVVPVANVVALAADLPAELGALVEPLAVGYHAARRAEVGAQDRVLVIGGGPIGQACLLAARRLGVTALAVSDPVGSRRDLCVVLGAAALDPGAGELGDLVSGALGGRPTVVIDAVGVSATLADALSVADLGARIVLVGMGSPRLELAAYAVSTEERSIVGSFTYSASEFADTAAWVGTRPAGIDRLIDGRVGFPDAAQSFDDLARGRSTASKILVFPGGVPG
ncbi:MAG: zinc-dependent alcohol dehydrogenase [Propionibacteriaceae bacterium]